MNILVYIAIVPMVLALLCFAFSRAAAWIVLAVSAAVMLMAAQMFVAGGSTAAMLGLQPYQLNAGMFLAASLFTFLIVLYSLKFMEGKERLGEYYGYILITLGATGGALFAGDYLMLLVFWGILGATLYMLIGIGGPKAADAGKKAMIIVGGSDALMILGISIIWTMTNSLRIGMAPLALNGVLPLTAFFCLIAAAFAKAGAIPLHSWIPDSAEDAPVTVMALLPAALDKLLGIYLLVRICFNIFIIEPNSFASIFLLLVGSATILVGVMGALVQHNLKKLLSFHAVSQVGYMILGIGTGIPVAIAGGIFHMFNNTIYKLLLFLTSGAVEKQAGTTELSELGGLAKFMPLTFIAAAIAALSISGVPPFNGFVSKWMIYQGIVEMGKTTPYWVIWLLAAMFGSALTLASFIKVIHAVFLGQWSQQTAKTREVPFAMWLPMLILATLCVLFGLFAYSLPLAYLVLPSFKSITLTGVWDPGLATWLLLLGLLAGAIIYWLGNTKTVSPKPAYIGGEVLEEKLIKVSGIDFYNTIREWVPLGGIYCLAEKKSFDLYQIGKKTTMALAGFLSWLHNGLLHTYLAWIFLGGIALFVLLMR